MTLLLDEEDLPTVGIAWLAEQGGSFDFWRDEGEEIYSIDDGDPLGILRPSFGVTSS